MITFVKDEENKLGFIATKLRSIIDYELLKLLRVYEGIFLGMRYLKCATYDDKVSTGWILVNVKKTQVNL